MCILLTLIVGSVSTGSNVDNTGDLSQVLDILACFTYNGAAKARDICKYKKTIHIRKGVLLRDECVQKSCFGAVEVPQHNRRC